MLWMFGESSKQVPWWRARWLDNLNAEPEILRGGGGSREDESGSGSDDMTMSWRSLTAVFVAPMRCSERTTISACLFRVKLERGDITL